MSSSTRLIGPSPTRSSGQTSHQLLARHPNLLVQRTLSKDFALAGLRVGYGLASAPLVEALSRARPPFSVNVLALGGHRGGGS